MTWNRLRRQAASIHSQAVVCYVAPQTTFDMWWAKHIKCHQVMANKALAELFFRQGWGRMYQSWIPFDVKIMDMFGLLYDYKNRSCCRAMEPREVAEQLIKYIELQRMRHTVLAAKVVRICAFAIRNYVRRNCFEVPQQAVTRLAEEFCAIGANCYNNYKRDETIRFAAGFVKNWNPKS